MTLKKYDFIYSETEITGNIAVVGGAGIQLGSIVAASYAVATLLKKPHPLKRLFS